jgi:hypothetical protein
MLNQRSQRLNLALFVSLFIMVGCLGPVAEEQDQSAAASSNNKPKWISAFSTEEVLSGGVWKIYLKGTDPDKDLKFIIVNADVPAGGPKIYKFRIDPDQRDLVSGYLMGDTSTFALGFGIASSSQIYFRLVLEDQAGNVSEPVEFPVSISMSADPKSPPEGVFQERLLGRIQLAFTS